MISPLRRSQNDLLNQRVFRQEATPDDAGQQRCLKRYCNDEGRLRSSERHHSMHQTDKSRTLALASQANYAKAPSFHRLREFFTLFPCKSKTYTRAAHQRCPHLPPI